MLEKAQGEPSLGEERVEGFGGLWGLGEAGGVGDGWEEAGR